MLGPESAKFLDIVKIALNGYLPIRFLFASGWPMTKEDSARSSGLLVNLDPGSQQLCVSLCMILAC